MTCIIGGKCKDGVILAADKKITNPEGLFEFKEKLFIFQKDHFYYPIVVGSSGTIPLYDKFKREAIEELKIINPNPSPFSSKGFSDHFNVSGRIYPYTSMTNSGKEVILYPYLEKLENIIKEYKKTYAHEIFDVLFAAQIQHKDAILSYISAHGLSEDIDRHKTIGIGEQTTNVFLNILNPNEMWMK